MEITGIKYIAPVLDNSGYAKASRQNILALNSLGIPLTVQPMSFEQAKPDLGKDGEILNSLISKDIDYNIVIMHCTPEFYERFREADKINLGYTIWETTKLHPDWPKYINKNVSALFVGCEWNVDIFKDSGVTVPVFNAPHCVSTDGLADTKPFDVKGVDKDTFMFYSIMQWCYDDKTRVLTRAGFKYFNDLTYNDELATLNKVTEELEYHKPDKIVKFRRKDKMLSLKSPQFDVCVTPDHKMVVKEHVKGGYSVDPNKPWELKPFNELLIDSKKGELKVSTKYRTKKNCKWVGEEREFFDIPILKSKPNMPTHIEMDTFLKFLGWYISEGSLNKGVFKGKARYYRVCITQTKSEENITEIINCVKDMGFTPFATDKDVLFNSKELYYYLLQFGKCYEKFVPEFVKNLSSRQIKIFLTSAIKGDGSYHKNGTWCKYITTSKKLAEDIQECLLKIGYSGAISVSDPSTKKAGTIDGREIVGKRLQYTVSVNRENNEPSMYYSNLKEIDYDGYVHCATVKNHTMLVERNGKIIFSGNTERKAPLDLIKAYWSAFPNNEDVALVLKTYRSDYSANEKNAVRQTIKRLKSVCSAENFPPIYLILDMLSEDEINGLHKRGDCYASLDRGEGFGLSSFLAGAYGNPVIITGFGGATEYAKPDNSYLVDYVEIPVWGMPWSPWYKLEQNWAQASVCHGAELMKHVFNNREEANERGAKLQQFIQEEFTWEKLGNKMINAIRSI